MLRSMYSGISGMKNFQTKLDVIGNNIANVSTVGFKKGRITFQEMMSQTTSGAQGAAVGGNRGGINPVQVGLGSQQGSIDNLHTQGFRQTTSVPLDIALEGDGMFALGLEMGDNGTASDVAYTRAGNFYLDEEGDIVNADGYYLLDTGGKKINIPSGAESFSVQTDGTVSLVGVTDGIVRQIGVALFSNPQGLNKIGGSLYRTTDNAGMVDREVDGLGTPGDKGRATLIAGSLEMSNVDLAEEFTEMIVAQRGFQANTRIISTSDQILEELVNLKR